MLALSLLLFAAPAPLDAAGACPAIAHFVKDEARADALVEELVRSAAAAEKRLSRLGPADGTANAIVRHVIDNLAEKQARDRAGPPLPMTADEIARTVIAYEAFKLERFVTSGVFPKRYFGYLDGKHDTAAYERTVRDTTRRVVSVINAYQLERKHPIRVSDVEIVVTFLAEGGAILLRERQDLLAALHPVLQVGLDDVAMGFSDLPGLEERIDREVGTRLGTLVGWMPAGAASLPEPSAVPDGVRWLKHDHGAAGPFAYLRRYMTLEEAIAGTALMYLWEKELAVQKMASHKTRALHERPLAEQFIIASLVYNSGTLHAPARWEMIRDFDAAAWVAARSERNAATRGRLNVMPAVSGLDWIRSGHDYPEQLTSWLAVYHVLQRYGALVALRDLTDHFTADGAFTR
jgi:hypothetical protein